MRKVCPIVPLVLLLAPACLPAQSVKPSILLTALKEELTRSMEQLKKQPTPPYFMSYEVVEVETVETGASFGSLVYSRPPVRWRYLQVDLRVGSYQLDNT